MTFDNDFCVWRWHYRDRHSRVSVNAQTTRAMHPVSRTYYIAQWSSHLDWSKFVYRDEYRNDKKCCFLRVFVKKIHIKHKQLSKYRLLMTIITLHHLCFGHCVNSSVIVLDLGIFLRELRSLRKIPRSKTITDEFTQWPKQRWCKVIIVINNRYFDNCLCFMCIFLTKTRRKQHFLSFLYSSL